MKSFKFPTAHTVLILIAAFVAVLTYIIPSGQFNRLAFDKVNQQFAISGSSLAILPASQKSLDSLGVKIPLEKFTSGDIWKPIGIPGTYHATPARHQGLLAFLQAPLKGISEAMDVILFVLILGGAIGVVYASGAFDAGVASLAQLLKGREFLLIIIITSLIAAGGTTFGLAEETIAFYPILVPVFLAAGYDVLVAIACIYLGSCVGTMVSTVNPFSTIIGSDAAGINWLVGINMRFLMLLLTLSITLAYILRYGRKVKQNPAASMVFAQKEELENTFLRKNKSDIKPLDLRQKLVLLVFLLCFVVMIYGVSNLDWWFMEMTTLFFAGSILMGFVANSGEENFVNSFISGAKDLLSVALIIGVARGVTVLMENGQISDTMLYYASNLVNGMPKALFINVLFYMYAGLSLFIPSSSGMAVLTMPIFAPLADVVDIGRENIVNAYLYGQGLISLINPTGLILASLTMVNISFGKWLKFVMPLLWILLILSMLVLTIGVY